MQRCVGRTYDTHRNRTEARVTTKTLALRTKSFCEHLVVFAKSWERKNKRKNIKKNIPIIPKIIQTMKKRFQFTSEALGFSMIIEALRARPCRWLSTSVFTMPPTLFGALSFFFPTFFFVCWKLTNSGHEVLWHCFEGLVGFYHLCE